MLISSSKLHSLLSATTAIQLGKIWEEFDCMFYEEPVNYLNVDLHNKVSKSLKIPSAAGERIYTRWGYRQYFEKQALNIIQPDLGLVGGITEGKKICDYADVYDIAVQASCLRKPGGHCSGIAVGGVIPELSYPRTPHIRTQEGNIRLCKQNYQPKNGKLRNSRLPRLINRQPNEDAVSGFPKYVVRSEMRNRLYHQG